MRLLVTPSFERTTKKLHKQQKTGLDAAVRSIIANPEIGEEKIGDLAGIRTTSLVYPTSCICCPIVSLIKRQSNYSRLARMKIFIVI